MKPLSRKHRKFADEYLKDMNATRAAIRAGYKKEGAHVTGNRLIVREEIRAYIDEQLEKMHERDIADAEEILAFFSAVMRDETIDTTVIPAGLEVKFGTTVKDRVRAAENLAKCHGMYDTKLKVEGNVPVVIVDDLGKED